jgi:hypothetical protein
VSTICRPTNNFTFQVETSHLALLSHSMKNEWVVDSRCPHNMVKHSSLFTSLNKVEERKIYVFDGFTLDIVGQGDVSYQHGRIVVIYHVPNLSANLLYVAQLTHTCKIVLFWPDQFFVEDLKKVQSFFIGGFLYPKDSLYKFCDMNRPDIDLTTLVSHTNRGSRTWNERPIHLIFQSLQSMETHNMVVGLPKVFPPKGVCK